MMNDIITLCISSTNKKGLASDISPHFGKTPFFTLIRFKNGKILNIKTIEGGKREPESKTSTDIIIDSPAEVVISGIFGKKSESLLRKKGIKLFSGASGRVKDALNEWKKGNLPLAQENLCRLKCCFD